MWVPTTPGRPVQPPGKRVGSILVETLRVYRRAWLRVLGLTVISTAAGLALFLALAFAWRSFGSNGVAGFLILTARLGALGRGTVAGPLTSLLALWLVVAIAATPFYLPWLAWQAAVTLLTDAAIRSERRSIWSAYATGLARAPWLAPTGLLYWLGVGVLAVLAIGLLVVTRAYALVGLLVALIGVGAWTASARLRKSWLKWLIIVAAPFGLSIYFGVQWSLWVQAVVLERAGPVQAIQRSSQLVHGHWFRVFAVWACVGFLTLLLEALLSATVGAVLASVAAPGMRLQGIRVAPVIGGVLLGALPVMSATLLFLALRHRQDGAKLIPLERGLAG